MLAYNVFKQLWPLGMTDVCLNGVQLPSTVLAPDNLVLRFPFFMTELCNIYHKSRTAFYLAKLPQTNKFRVVTPTHTRT